MNCIFIHTNLYLLVATVINNLTQVIFVDFIIKLKQIITKLFFKATNTLFEHFTIINMIKRFSIIISN